MADLIHWAKTTGLSPAKSSNLIDYLKIRAFDAISKGTTRRMICAQ